MVTKKHTSTSHNFKVEVCLIHPTHGNADMTNHYLLSLITGLLHKAGNVKAIGMKVLR